MSGFFNVQPPDEALQTLLGNLDYRVDLEYVPALAALGRVLRDDVFATEDLPPFARSTMDGYSVRSADTFGATEDMPAFIEVVGDVPMGTAQTVSLSPGEAATAFTGGMLAGNADAVVMVENTQVIGDSSIEVLRPVAPGENVAQPGEDVITGDAILPSGHVVRPQDIGGLLALGMTDIRVARRPRVAIVSTGDELVPPGETPGPGRIRDINSYTISALVERAGGVPERFGLIRDDLALQQEAAQRGLDESDMLIFSAGSSVSSRDLTAEVIASLGSPGILTHGISFKPGKPTIVALVDGKPVFGLPGNPVSAAVVFDMLVRPAIYWIAGCAEPPSLPSVTALLASDIPSLSGRQDVVQVRLAREGDKLTAEPVFGGSGLIFTLVQADGAITVPMDRGGMYAGEQVQVRLY
ncbi:MAG: molybdopterin-binding protein [SAR202 cluster bacterium]|nr:molybdopterin-binding protein [SAR202 cluster bacterium]